MRKSIILAACLLALLLVLPAPAQASWYWNRIPHPPTPTEPAPQPPAPPAPPEQGQPPAPPEQGQPPAPPASDPGSLTPLTDQEAQAVALVNRARADAGLPPLAVNPVLTELARKKSQDMVVNHYFSHTSPTYGTAYDMEVAAGIRARVMGGENIAKARNAMYAHAMFMGSSGHRANILNPNYTEIGIGIVPNGPYGIAETQLFIGR